MSDHRSRELRAASTPIHLGTRTQVRGIEVVDEQERLIGISRCTPAIVERDPRGDRPPGDRRPSGRPLEPVHDPIAAMSVVCDPATR